MMASPTELRVLHGLRLKGFIEAPLLAAFLGLEVGETERELRLAAENGYCSFRDGNRSGWSLTAEGRKENERMLAVEIDDAGRRIDVESAYRDFLVLNGPMLAACTRWQVKDLSSHILNDHTDPSYDAAVVAEVSAIHSSVEPICAELGTWFERFAGYGPRFATALERLLAGQTDWFTKPTIDSYHTVWFELHEDLLVTLGIDRASERT